MVTGYNQLIRGVCILILCLFIGPLNGWSEEAIPLPDDTVLVRQNGPGNSQLSFTMSIYKSSKPVAQVYNFFWKSLKDLGWGVDKQKDGSLLFQKDGEYVVVVAVPPRKQGGKTLFSLTRQKKISMEKLYASKKDKPDKLSFMPIYPNAKQDLLMDLPNGGVSAGYSTDDSIKDIKFFYTASMPNYGWSLFSAGPIVEAPIKDCPSCRKNLVLPVGVKLPEYNIKGSTQRCDLVFKKVSGETCMIHLQSQKLDNFSPQVSLPTPGGASILVTYIDVKAK